ncbi:hypothetical protein [Brevundimonas sp.]|jgi:hypothetical protein|uniref:hypothetical protein n=1 Tax=Brevundimonas sp. TaxID=1871086 RepID=UPI0037BE98D0
MSQDPQNHEQMLAEIQRSQDAVRERVAKGSWSYDLTYASVAAAIVGCQAAPLPFNVLASVGATLAFVTMWRRWSERTGVSITGVSPPRARWVAIALGVLFGGLALTSVYVGRTGQLIWVAPLTIAAFVLALGLSRLWMRVYRAETAGRV